jgi:hypothetical protein
MSELDRGVEHELAIRTASKEAGRQLFHTSNMFISVVPASMYPVMFLSLGVAANCT